MRFSILLLPLLLSILLVNCQDLRSTGEICADGRTTTQISCNSNEILFITSVTNTYSDKCNGFNIRNDNLNKCESKYMHNLNDYCNGKQTCNIKLQQFDNVIGLHKSTCTFKSNKMNIFYVCVPKTYNAYDKVLTMCGSPAVVSTNDVKSAFIRSPNYPEYYGNNRACTLQIKLEPNTRINMYLLNMNMEGLGIFSRVPKDFLKITTDSSDQQLYGSSSTRIVHNTTETVNLRFVSDFITSTSLDKPKGFLLYFKTLSTLKPTQPPTTTTTQSSTTIIASDTDYNDEFGKIDADDFVGMRNNIDATTQETNAEFGNNFAPNNVFHEKYSNPKSNNQDGNKSIYWICVLVALAGLVVIAVASILLIIRRRKILRYRRQRQEESDYNYADGKIYENVTETTPKKVEMLNETVIGKDNKSELNLVTKHENIYSSTPVVFETIKSVKSSETEAATTAPANKKDSSINSEEIYECISEFDPSSSEDTTSSKIYDSKEDIYSTPTNKEVTNDDLNKLREQEQASQSVLDTTLDTSTAQLLNQKC